MAQNLFMKRSTLMDGKQGFMVNGKPYTIDARIQLNEGPVENALYTSIAQEVRMNLMIQNELLKHLIQKVKRMKSPDGVLKNLMNKTETMGSRSPIVNRNPIRVRTQETKPAPLRAATAPRMVYENGKPQVKSDKDLTLNDLIALQFPFATPEELKPFQNEALTNPTVIASSFRNFREGAVLNLLKYPLSFDYRLAGSFKQSQRASQRNESQQGLPPPEIFQYQVDIEKALQHQKTILQGFKIETKPASDQLDGVTINHDIHIWVKFSLILLSSTPWLDSTQN
jgi:hypothetical protein